MSRMTFWLPESASWIREEIKKTQREAEKLGVKLSEGAVILAALEQVWEKPPETCPPATSATAPAKQHKKRVVYFSNAAQEIVQTIEKIVHVKKLAGIKTSFSQEVCRMLQNQLLQTTTGRELDKKAIT